MTPGRPLRGQAPARNPRLRESDGAAGGDFAWPPPADDSASCSIVMLGDVEARPRLRVSLPADAPAEAFPDIDVETALDAFADSPVAPGRVRRAPDARRAPSDLPAPASWWRIDRVRGAVALCIAGSLALLPPPSLPSLEAAAAQPGPLEPAAPLRRALDQPVRIEPAPVATRHAVPHDEDRIRATLAELGSAYSQLDAVATREVWPSVDVDALARAFRDLQAQELRFDHCDVDVAGARARADCTGQIVYVQRAGDHGVRSAARAWTFQLTSRHGRWLIASGRAS